MCTQQLERYLLDSDTIWCETVRADKNLVQDKDQGFDNTEIHEGVVNLENIT